MSPLHRYRAVLLFVLWLASFELRAGNIRAYTKIYALQSRQTNQTSHHQQLSSANRLSYLASADAWSWEASAQLLLNHNSDKSQDAEAFLRSSPYRIIDREEPFIIESDGRIQAYHNIDRAFLTFQAKQLVMTLGRQPLSLGTSRFINPIDIFNPFSITSLDTEERAGVDAWRLRFYQDSSVYDLALLMGKDGQGSEGAAYGRYFESFSIGDLSLLVSQFKQRSITGVDFQSQYAGTGLTFAAARIQGKNQKFHRASMGAERRLPNDWMLSGEYHFNGLGSHQSLLARRLLADEDWQAAQVRFLGKHYFSFAVSKVLSPLSSLSTSNTINLEDQSSFHSLQYSYNAKQDQYADLGGMLSQGSSQSEFTLYDDMIYLSYRVYY